MASQRRASLPPIPDMRFESAFLAKINPYVTVTRLRRQPSEESDLVYVDAADEKLVPAGELIQIQWGNVIWATFRDQVLMMWLQGAVWSCIQAFAAPVYTRVTRRVQSTFKAEREGGASAWLRGWVQQLGLARH